MLLGNVGDAAAETCTLGLGFGAVVCPSGSRMVGVAAPARLIEVEDIIVDSNELELAEVIVALSSLTPKPIGYRQRR